MSGRESSGRESVPPDSWEVRLKIRVAPVLVLAALAHAGCGGAAPTIPPDASPSTRIEVRLTDGLRIEPDPLLVPAGAPVTFVVTNAGVLDHEIFFGDEAAQQAHGREVSGRGGTVFDGDHGIGLRPRETRVFTYTFASPGMQLAGCHVPGHYPSGMKATVVVR